PPRHLLAEGPLAASFLSEDSALAPEGLVASVLAASGLVARDLRFGQPCGTASATASLLASLRNPAGTPLGTPPCAAPESPAERQCPEDRPALSESRLRTLSRSALLAEVASAEMSLHAIYLHQLHQQQQQQPQGPGPQPAGAPKHPFVTTGDPGPGSVPGGWGDTGTPSTG
ncbi:ATG9A protein, partial [Spelaeornis formosus]|nr:ATG9A protein [Elachura formosa]